MPYAINLKLDDKSSTDIEQVYSQLAALQVSEQDIVTQYGPCVTLLIVTEMVSPETLARTLELRLPELNALAVNFSEPCIIQGSPPTLSLRVALTDSLLSFHSAIFSEFTEDDVHLHYRPAYWQPHLKLCNVRGGRLRADHLLTGVAATWLERGATLDTLEVVRYSPVQAVWQARLKQTPTSRPPNAM